MIAMIVLDAVAFRIPATWSWLEKNDEYGVARNHAILTDLQDRPTKDQRVMIIGTSRSAAFDVETANALRPDVEFIRVGRPGYTPMVVHSLLDGIIDAHPTTVVLMLSESDTHHPLRLEPAAGLPVANAETLLRLISMTDLAYVFENRHMFLRLLSASWVESFRLRNLVSSAGLEKLRKFASNRRMHTIAPGSSDPGIPLLGEKTRRQRPGPFPKSVLAQYRKSQHSLLHVHLNLWVRVRPGPHVDVHMAMVRSNAERLREAGIAVVILETPIHTGVTHFVDPICRREFVRFSNTLATERGLRFISLDDLAPYRNNDFKDLFHLNKKAGRRMTQQLVELLYP